MLNIYTNSTRFNIYIEEEKFLQEGVAYTLGVDGGVSTATGTVYHNKRKLNQFVHYENKFNNVNQTVVIWCLADFGAFKK